MHVEIVGGVLVQATSSTEIYASADMLRRRDYFLGRNESVKHGKRDGMAV
jgi:hypothetical protein